MPIDWKAKVPFKTFIACRDQQAKSGRPNAYTKTVYWNSDKKSVQITPNAKAQSLLPLIVESKVELSRGEREPYEIEGILVMQKMLLQELARRENAVKGLTSPELKQGTNCQRVIEPESKVLAKSPTPEADIEGWKKEMAQVLHTIWGGTQKS
jgi:hypothetical protein